VNYKLFNTYTSCWFCSNSDFISSKTCRTLSSWNQKRSTHIKLSGWEVNWKVCMWSY